MDIKIGKVSKIYSDGKHNAFTTICEYKGKKYIAFRNGTTHLTYDGKILIMQSNDGKNWKLISQVESSSGDLRDPRLIVFEDRLLLFSGERIENDNSVVSHGYLSENGINFVEYKMEGLGLNSFLWGLSVWQNKIYATAHICQEDMDKCFLYSSKDGAAWELVTMLPPGNETAITFDDKSKQLIALVRDESEPWRPTLCVASGPKFSSFEKSSKLPVRLQGIMIHKLDSGSVIVGRTWDLPRHNTRTNVYWFSDDNLLKKVGTLPSGGDCSYASWYKKSNNQALLSYYSAHDFIKDKTFKKGDSIEHCTGADIFLAELSFS